MYDIALVPDSEGWWRGGAGPAAPPAPLAAMTSQARASTWISLKPRSNSFQNPIGNDALNSDRPQRFGLV